MKGTLKIIFNFIKFNILSRQVSFEEGNALSKEINSEFVETSSKNGKNVPEAFMKLLDKIPEALIPQDNLIKDTTKVEPCETKEFHVIFILYYYNLLFYYFI